MSKNTHKRIRRVEKAISRLQRMHLVYVWGGARGGSAMIPPTSTGQGWSDCSGFAQYVLAVAGIDLKNPVGSTWSLAEEGEAGKNDVLTLFIKNPPGDEHVIVRLRKRPRPWHRGQTKYRWAECGGTDNPQAGGGPGWFTPGRGMGMTPERRVAEFPIHRKFPELS
jgi:hypothetical protein